MYYKTNKYHVQKKVFVVSVVEAGERDGRRDAAECRHLYD